MIATRILAGLKECVSSCNRNSTGRDIHVWLNKFCLFCLFVFRSRSGTSEPVGVCRNSGVTWTRQRSRYHSSWTQQTVLCLEVSKPLYKWKWNCLVDLDFSGLNATGPFSYCKVGGICHFRWRSLQVDLGKKSSNVQNLLELLLDVALLR